MTGFQPITSLRLRNLGHHLNWPRTLQFGLRVEALRRRNNASTLRILLLFLIDKRRESFQGLSGLLFRHDGFLDPALGVNPGGDGSFGHQSRCDPGGGNEGLGGVLVDDDCRFGILSIVLAGEVEEGEGGLGAGRALEAAEGGIGCDAGRVRDGRAPDAHDLVTRRKGVLEEVEADRAEEAWVVLEDAVGAELTKMSSVADVVEEPPLCGAADAAESLLEVGLVSLHCH